MCCSPIYPYRHVPNLVRFTIDIMALKFCENFDPLFLGVRGTSRDLYFAVL